MPAPLVAAAALGGGAAAGGAAAGGAAAAGAGAAGAGAGAAGAGAGAGAGSGGMQAASKLGGGGMKPPTGGMPGGGGMPKPGGAGTPKKGPGYDPSKKPNKPGNSKMKKANNARKNARDVNDARNRAKQNNGQDQSGEDEEEQKKQSGLEKAKQQAEQVKEQGKEMAKEMVKEKIKQQVKQKIISLLVQAAPYIAIGVGVIILIILVIFIIYQIKATFFPGTYGDESSDYSKEDRKILEKIASKTQLYPNVDAALALSVIYYPHNEELFSGNVLALIELNDDDYEEQEENDETEEEDLEEKAEEEENKDDEEAEDEEGNLKDLNLKVIEKHLDEYGQLLSSLSTVGEATENYLKTDYFINNKYYKDMLGRRKSGTEKQLIDAIYEDVLDVVPYVQNYIQNYYANGGNCTVTESDGGKIEFDTSKISNTYVQIVSNSCASDFDGCSSYVGPLISLKDYVLGVTYAEIGVSAESLDEEIKTQIIAAKSYTLGRSKAMGRKTGTTSDGKTIVYMKNSTNDQVYCDIYEGCPANGGSNAKPSLFFEQQERISKLYDSVSNIYVYDKESKNTYGAYVNDQDSSSSCSVGNCMFQEQTKKWAKEGKDYKAILYQSYSKEGRFALLDISTNTASIGKVDCTIANAINGVRSKPPTEADKYFNYPYSRATGSTKFQCVWYARGRAMEIVDTSDLDPNVKKKAIAALQSIGVPGAKDWWNHSKLNATFNSSADATKPKPGSLVIWRWLSSEVPGWAGGYNYGHIGIVETVEADGTVNISEGWRKRICSRSSESYNCMGFQYSTYSIGKVKLSSKYEFLGYYYLLEVKN